MVRVEQGRDRHSLGLGLGNIAEDGEIRADFQIDALGCGDPHNAGDILDRRKDMNRGHL